jgi:hypothetical protein
MLRDMSSCMLCIHMVFHVRLHRLSYFGLQMCVSFDIVVLLSWAKHQHRKCWKSDMLKLNVYIFV